MSKDYLEHYGRKGMHWYEHRFGEADSRAEYASKIGAKAKAFGSMAKNAGSKGLAKGKELGTRAANSKVGQKGKELGSKAATKTKQIAKNTKDTVTDKEKRRAAEKKVVKTGAKIGAGVVIGKVAIGAAVIGGTTFAIKKLSEKGMSVSDMDDFIRSGRGAFIGW